MCKAMAWAQGLGRLRLLRAWGLGLDFLRPSSGRAKPSRARTPLDVFRAPGMFLFPLSYPTNNYLQTH